MGSTDLDFANLDELADLLVAGGVRSVSTDPAKVNTPGVWIRFDGVELDQLAGCTIRTTLFLVVGQSTMSTVQTGLADLFNIVAPILATIGGPTGPTLAAGLVLPGSTTPLPALAVPLELLTTKEA